MTNVSMTNRVGRFMKHPSRKHCIDAATSSGQSCSCRNLNTVSKYGRHQLANLSTAIDQDVFPDADLTSASMPER